MTQQNINVKGAAKKPENHFQQPKPADAMLWYSPSADSAWYASWNGNSWDLYINGLGLDEMRARYPDLVTMYSESFHQLRYEQNRKPVSEISEEHFTDMLEVMPPVNWSNPGNGQGRSFMMEEIFPGAVSDIYVEWQGRFFSLRDDCALSHEEILNVVKKAISAN